MNRDSETRRQAILDHLGIKDAFDPFHTNGRCTCAAEGTCPWCKKTEAAEAELDANPETAAWLNPNSEIQSLNDAFGPNNVILRNIR